MSLHCSSPSPPRPSSTTRPPDDPTAGFSCKHCGAHIRIPAGAKLSPRTKLRCPGCRSVESPLGAQARPSAPPPVQLAAAPAPSLPPPVQARPQLERWSIDTVRYREQTFDADELNDMARYGRLRAHDRVRGPGFPDWTAADEVGSLQTSFKLRRKEIDARLRSLARKPRHRCCQHADIKASFICTECAATYCGKCPVIGRCPECTAKLTAL